MATSALPGELMIAVLSWAQLARLPARSTQFSGRPWACLDLGTLGGTSSEALGINHNGDITRDSSLKSKSVLHAFLEKRGSHMQDLGTLGGASSFGNAVNVSRTVVGNSLTGSGAEHAFLWTSAAGMRDLGTFGGTSNAIGINASGHVVGFSALGAGSPFHAFWWTESGGM